MFLYKSTALVCFVCFAHSVVWAQAEVTPEQGRAYLLSLNPTKEQLKQWQSWIDDLGNRSFVHREIAEGELAAVAAPAAALLRENAQSEDAEVRKRVERLLKTAASESDQTLLTAFAALEKERVEAGAAAVISAIENCHEPNVIRAASRALAAQSAAEDEAVLRRELASEDFRRRIAAIAALEHSLDDRAALSVAAESLDDVDERVRVAASRTFAHRTSHAALGRLVEALGSEDQTVRNEAALLLRSFTGKQFGYASYADKKSRDEGQKLWSQWYAKNGRTAKLRKLSDAPLLKGKVLYARFNPFGVMEADLKTPGDKKDLGYQKQVLAACGICVSKNGDRAFADWSGRALVVLDEKGKLRWKKELGDLPNALELLDNGNYLVGLYNTMKIQEITPDKEVLWEVKLPGRPTGIARMKNGNTLVTMNQSVEVIELDGKRKIVRKIPVPQWTESVRLCINGDMLIACGRGNALLRYDSSGKKIWEFNGAQMPYDGVELPGGNILVGHSGGVTEINSKGKKIRSFDVGTVRRICLY